jgi:hypothetical protein
VSAAACAVFADAALPQRPFRLLPQHQRLVQSSPLGPGQPAAGRRASSSARVALRLHVRPLRVTVGCLVTLSNNKPSMYYHLNIYIYFLISGFGLRISWKRANTRMTRTRQAAITRAFYRTAAIMTNTTTTSSRLLPVCHVRRHVLLRYMDIASNVMPLLRRVSACHPRLIFTSACRPSIDDPSHVPLRSLHPCTFCTRALLSA